MKKILGLDLGTTSIGWALVNEAEDSHEQSEIIKLGVRVNPLTTDEQTDFEKGKPLSTNADRTLKRGARRNLQRYKLRRANLIQILIREGFISNDTILTENGKGTTHETLRLRAKAASERIEKEQFARVLLAINKKRGYKSSRKAKNEEEGSLIDGMAIAKELYDNKLTPGQYVLNLLKQGKKYIPDFYRSDLQNEFDAVWNFQRGFYPDVLTDEFYKKLQGQGQGNSRKMFLAIHQIYTAQNKGKRDEVKMQHYLWRSDAIHKHIPIDVVAYVLVEINNNLNKSSGYLGAISDRSKELYFNNETVGQNIYKQLQQNFHTSLKNQVFYRQDYLDEFEKIWETQAMAYPELTYDLKAEIRDVVIFYQRKLKSQKHLISHCEFERFHKVVPKSSPLFQEFKIWQIINNLEFQNKLTKEKKFLGLELKQLLFEELNLRGNLKSDAVLKILGLPKKEWSMNYKDGLEGNHTNQLLYNVFRQIAENEGYGFDWEKKTAREIKEELWSVFPQIGIQAEILDFNPNIEENAFDKQSSYQFWHLLYSAEDDENISEEDKLVYGNSSVLVKKKLYANFGFKPEYANLLANISFKDDYGSLSARAIRKIFPFLEAGHKYPEACRLAGYNHSHSKTKEELASRKLEDKMELLKKNSLRNPVVEKILNQMVNVVNQVVETYGKPDEVRVELARELKKTAAQREEMTRQINKAKGLHEDIRKLLQKDFGLKNPTRNDIIRYKLYEELCENGYKTLYTDKYIPKEKLFSKEIDIEHIIPKARLFDDSFSNKTLSYRDINLDKGDATAIDFITDKHNSELENYKARVEHLYKADKIKKGKYKKLLMAERDLPDDFIERDLRNSQYIAKKATQMLQEVIRTVNTTTGSITDKLREDWDLINLMKELNLPKYRALGLTEIQERKEGKTIEKIIDWTKRNDHRHHAMDALTVAFTTRSHVQYLNNLNASRDRENSTLYGIRNKITCIVESNNGSGKRKFVAPMPNFRTEAKNHMESILISIKSKNKVVTKNKNRIKQIGKDAFIEKVQLTPRGQLHKETVYGKSHKQLIKEVKVGSKLNLDTINKVTKPIYREALLERLVQNGNDPKKAFAGKNAPTKNPIFLNNQKTDVVPEKVQVLLTEEIYTIRKEIGPDLKIEKVIDEGVKRVLKSRLEEFGGNAKEAFSNLDKKPIWLNKERGISIKRVTISGVNNVEALHDKKDHMGRPILGKDGKTQAVDFVSTGNNHHVAIYRDEKGKLQEQVVSFYEAVARVNAGLPIVDRGYRKNEGWKFLFTMKQNEYFVFPAADFNPEAIDLLNPENAKIISPHLYRVQKIATKNYFFRHHLETSVQERKELKDVAYKPQLGLSAIEGIVKVRINHIGEVECVGEDQSMVKDRIPDYISINY